MNSLYKEQPMKMLGTFIRHIDITCSFDKRQVEDL